MVQFRLNGFCLNFSIRNLFPALFSEGQTSNNITYASLHHKYSRTSVPLIPFMASRPPALNYLNGVFMVIEGCTNLNTVQYSLLRLSSKVHLLHAYMYVCRYTCFMHVRDVPKNRYTITSSVLGLWVSTKIIYSCV